MPISGWEAVVIGHIERIRVELAFEGDEAIEEYKELFDACTAASVRLQKKARAEATPRSRCVHSC